MVSPSQDQPGRAARPRSEGAALPARRPAVPLAEHRAAWLLLLGLVVLEFGLGIVCVIMLPIGRPSGWLPPMGTTFYLLHGVIGALLCVGSLALLLSANHCGSRPLKICAVIGVVGVGLGAGGGLFAVDKSLRVIGVLLMFVGAIVAAMGYLMPAVGGAFGGSAASGPAHDDS